MTRIGTIRWALWMVLLATLGTRCLPAPTPAAPAEEPTVVAPSPVPPTPTWTSPVTNTAPPPTPTATLRPTSTLAPTATPSPTSTPTSTPAPTATHTLAPPSPTTPPPVPPIDATVLLEPMNHEWQTANNCGPASTAIVLSYYGHWVTQQEVNEQIPAGSLAPCDIVLYIPQYHLMARLYYSPPVGEPIRQLLDHHIPVIFNQWLSLESPVRHYRVIQGYDAARGEFISTDPLRGPYLRIAYDTFATMSNPGNFIPVYPPEMDPLVQSLMRGLGVGEIPCP